MNEKTVDTIVDLCRQGDAKAFDDLVEIFGRRLYAHLYAITGNHADADDLLQETLLKAFENIRRFQKEGSFAAWLFEIAHNLALDHARSEKSRSERAKRFASAWGEPGGSENLPETAALAEETNKRLMDALQTLPIGQRAAISLFAVEGLPIREIARILGVAQGTVMSHLHRAKTTLRTKLQEVQPKH